MNLYYSPGITEPFTDLPDEEAHHAFSVMRSRIGDRIGLLDGRGSRAEAEIVELDRKRGSVKILHREVLPAERRWKIHMAVALTKNIDRFEWFLEKAVEIGVDRITPLITDRSERTKFRVDRGLKVMIAAMKQSRRVWLPILDQPKQLKEIIAATGPPLRFFGWCEGEHEALMQAYTGSADAIFVIGPEGDLSMDEADRLKQQGFRPVSIGSARLRTETAAIAACTWMSLFQQR